MSESSVLDHSVIVTAKWLEANGWEPYRDSSMFWYSRKVPFVLIRLCEVQPQLRIGTSAVGWHIVTEKATEQDVIDLVRAMKITDD